MKVVSTSHQLDKVLAQAAIAKLVHLQLLPTDRVINIAGGHGDFAIALSAHSSLVEIVDHSEDELHEASDNAARHSRNNIAYVHGDWQQIPLRPADMIFVGPLLSLRDADLPFLYSLAKQSLVLVTAVGGTPHAYHGIHPELADSYKKHLTAAKLNWDSDIIHTGEADYEMIWVRKPDTDVATEQ
ncbi:class I SAM-dependent methyltransferase [Lacticaseibacillus pabuli]|uniref:Class I SAM-dependent methyltransferase n=1 Tax=Lacticaseibacillus pabuli TaxID=3025672 RepID=A0ABY7WTP0_9LACO|nr:class I SAM-dependent methyltransferase [Lacticaseibacillus sp. KACC 23028]WDF82520.1 class I SAM-dependent methyltransferase [Lacticaseibacillus sp. KACC 23028]